MGKGRAPCCDKSKVKRGPWSPAEDTRLISFIQIHGHGNWRALPKQAGLLRCGKSCRLRWINYLRPDVKRGNFSPEEEQTIISLHKTIGNKWSKIASHLPGRTDNEIKNVWNTYLKKKLINTSADDAGHGRGIEMSKGSSTSYSASPSPSSSSCISYGDLSVLDKGPREVQDQEGQESTTFAPLPITTVSSVQECKPDDARGDSQLQTGMTKETTKESVGDQMVTEIPLPMESDDIGVWSMFDASFDPKGESNIVAQPQECYEVWQRSSSLGEGHEEQEVDEYQNWLTFLENELGLSGGADTYPALEGEDQQQQVLATRGTEEETTLRPETGPQDDMAYFPIWPSSPQNFDFSFLNSE